MSKASKSGAKSKWIRVLVTPLWSGAQSEVVAIPVQPSKRKGCVKVGGADVFNNNRELFDSEAEALGQATCCNALTRVPVATTTS
jgi:hypothetical protein